MKLTFVSRNYKSFFSNWAIKGPISAASWEMFWILFVWLLSYFILRFRILKEGPPGIGWGKGVEKSQPRTKFQTSQTNNYDHLSSVSFETCSEGIKLILYHKWWTLTMDCIQKSHPHWEWNFIHSTNIIQLVASDMNIKAEFDP